jgi:hypothetical protein
MSDGGSVSVSVRLGLEQLQRDATAAAQKIRASIKDVEAPVAIKFDNAQITKLGQDILKVKASLAGDPKGAQLLQKEAALLEEAVRFKQQLAEIDGAGFSEDDVRNAQALAVELNRLNLDRIEKEFGEAEKAGRDFTTGFVQGIGQQVTASLTNSITNALGDVQRAIGIRSTPSASLTTPLSRRA